jgi:hypothetical protein
MSRSSGSRVLAVAIPIGAIVMVALALLWTIDAIPRVPIASEVIGLLAVLLAPGIAVEPAFHGERWTLMERVGLAAALSLALAGILGVGLHLAGVPVSPTNVLSLVLVVTAPVGALSIRFRVRRPARPMPRTMRLQIVVGLGSLLLLAAGFASILVLRPAPEGPRLEIMAVDGAGRLVTMPIQSSTGGTTLTIAARSASGAATSASLAVDGDGIRQWSASDVAIGTGWTAVEVPIETTRTGTLLAHVTVRGGGAELTLPIAMDVAR